MFCLYSGEIRSNAPINGLPQDGRGGGGGGGGHPREIWHF